MALVAIHGRGSALMHVRTDFAVKAFGVRIAYDVKRANTRGAGDRFRVREQDSTDPAVHRRRQHPKVFDVGDGSFEFEGTYAEDCVGLACDECGMRMNVVRGEREIASPPRDPSFGVAPVPLRRVCDVR